MPAFPPADWAAALARPTVQTTDPQTGYVYDTTSPEWKAACGPLPSCKALSWPGYATIVYADVINGVPVIVQPWMGRCEQVFGRGNFPGGFGGEVGVYVKVPEGRPLPDMNGLPLLLRPAIEALALIGNGNLWWPDASFQPAIDFTIINPVANNAVVRADTENNYWVNRWMESASFAQYEQANAGKLPASPTDYKMIFTVNGQTRSWTGADAAAADP